MKLTYLLIFVLLAVGAVGVVMVTRPGLEQDLPTNDEPMASPIDNTTPFPPPEPTPLAGQVKPINEQVDIVLKTTLGDIALTLDGATAPITVGNFITLAQAGFYDGTTFHRVIPEFMIQGGDPLSKNPQLRPQHGTGGPGYKFNDEQNEKSVVRGVIAMANAGPNTNGSQFFIVTGEAFPHLDGKHTVFGAVTNGIEVADKISLVEADQRDNPVEPVVVESIEILTSLDPALKVE